VPKDLRQRSLALMQRLCSSRSKMQWTTVGRRDTAYAGCPVLQLFEVAATNLVQHAHLPVHHAMACLKLVSPCVTSGETRS